jgi:hypothetical protein
MQEYEYKVAVYKKLKAVEKEMNKAAEDGWRVHKVKTLGDSAQLVVVYERKYNA